MSTVNFGTSEFNPLGQKYQPIEKWWECKDSTSMADAIAHTVNVLRSEQTYIHDRQRKAIELYENVDIGNLIVWQFATPTNVDGPYDYNVVEQIVDTLHAEIVSNRTRPQFITEGGDWVSQERAGQLTHFADGLFTEADIHEVVAPAICRDALVFGTGIAKVFSDNGKICAERVFPYDIVVDDVAAALAPPRTMYHSKLCPRDAIHALFGDTEANRRIIDSSRCFDGTIQTTRVVQDIVAIHEAWRLPTGNVKGRHVISMEDGVLLDEEWEHDFFPFAILRYKNRTKGFWGKGVPEILEGHQELINDLRDKINAQIQLAAPFLWVKTGTRIREAGLSNEIGRVIESDEPPQMVVYASVPQDLMNRLSQEVADAGSLVGANTLMMKSEMPPGLNSGSGRALRIYNDTKSKRFMAFARAYESWHIELCKLMIRIADIAHETGEKVSVMHQDEDYLEKISYKSIKLPQSSYTIKPQPVNFLSDTPSGRLSDIEALAGIFPEELKPKLAALLQNPDLQNATNYLNADEDAIGKACSSILRGQKTSAEVAPTAYLDLNLAIALARTILLQAQTKGAPEDRLLDLENWIAMCKDLLEKSQPPAPPPMPPMDPAIMGGAPPPMDMPMDMAGGPPPQGIA